VKEPAVKRRNALLETGKLAIKRCRGEEEKKLCITSILLLIYTVRGYTWSNRWDIDYEKNGIQDRTLGNTTRWGWSGRGTRDDWERPVW
jgi:hypothetical protein